MANSRRANRPQTRYNLSLGYLMVDALEARSLAAPVFSIAPGAFQPIGTAISIVGGAGAGSQMDNQPGGAFSSDYGTYFTDFPTDSDPIAFIQESGAVLNSYTGPQIGDAVPGTLQSAQITVLHTSIDTVQALNYDIGANFISNIFPNEFTSASSNGNINLNISNTTSSNLGTSVLNVNFTADVSAETPGFFRTGTLVLTSNFLTVVVNDDGVAGLTATDASGSVIYDDPDFAVAADGDSDSLDLNFDVDLPNVATVPVAMNYNSTLTSGPALGAPEDFYVPAHTTQTQIASFNYTLNYTVR